jgi:hypothetical protein
MNHVNRGVGIATLVAVLFVAPLRTGVTSAQQSPPGFPAAGEPPVVTMLSAGAAPRTALRYALETGQSSTMEMGMLMSMAMEMGGMAAPEVQMPLMKFTATLEVTEVAANGDISYRVKFSGNTVEDTPGVDPSIIAAMRGQNLDLTGVESLGTVTSRGLTKSVTFDLDKVSNPQLKQTLGSMSSTIESLSIPLPEEAVGVGARWEVRQRSNFNDLVMFQKTTVEVTAMEGNTLTMATTVEQTAPSQSMTNPALPPGTEVQLRELMGTASGSGTMRLNALVPTSEASGRMSMVMDVSVAGTNQTMSMVMTTKMTVSPVR